jgi:hypothetical protein
MWKSLALLVGGAAVAMAACGDDSMNDPDARRWDSGIDYDAGVDAGPTLDAAPVFDATPDNDATPDYDATPNSPPTISDIADQMTQFPAIGPIAFTVGDAETALASLVVTASSNDQGVVPDGNLVLAGTDGDRNITVTPIASGTATITVTVDDGTDTASDTFDVMVTNNGPVGVADDYDWFGNSELTVADTAGVLANDTDDDMDMLTATVVNGGATTLGGTFDLAADGSFAYQPPVDVTAMTDTFMYNVTDGFVTSAGTVTINLTEMVWYVDNSAAAGGDGRSHTPFDTLTEAATAADVDEIIFVFEGDGMTTGQSDGVSLQDGQSLIGEGVGLEIDMVTVIAAGNDPVITNTAGAGVLLNGNATVRGLTIDSPNSDGITGNSIDGATIRDVTIIASNGQGIDIGNTSPSATMNILIQDNTISGNGTDFTTTTFGIDVSIQGTGGGNVVADIINNGVSGVTTGIIVDVGGTTGNGAGGPNLVTLDDNTITDVDDDAMVLIPDEGTTSEFFVTNNTIDGIENIGAATPVRGLDFRSQTEDGGDVEITVTGNVIDDMGGEGLNLVSTGTGNSGTVVMLLDNNTVTDSGSDGIAIAADDTMVFHVTSTNNTCTGNANPSTYEFFTGTAHIMNLNLADNEDDAGFRLERDAVGVLNLGGTLGQGMAFVDDNGNVANNGNTTSMGAPNVVISGAGQLINIIDAATILTP